MHINLARLFYLQVRDAESEKHIEQALLIGKTLPRSNRILSAHLDACIDALRSKNRQKQAEDLEKRVRALEAGS